MGIQQCSGNWAGFSTCDDLWEELHGTQHTHGIQCTHVRQGTFSMVEAAQVHRANKGVPS